MPSVGLRGDDYEEEAEATHLELRFDLSFSLLKIKKNKKITQGDQTI